MLTLLLDADLHTPDRVGVRSLLLADGRIVWIGAGHPTLDQALGVDVVDLEGATVIPGLVDGHVHITGGGGEGGPATDTPPPTASSYTVDGVTTVVGLLGTDDVVRTPASVLRRVRALRDAGVDAWMLTGGYALPPATVTGDVRDDLVHLGPVLGVGEIACSDHRGSAPEPTQLVRLAARVRTAALLAGKAGTLHLHLGDAPTRTDPIRAAVAASAVPARHWHPTHVNRTPELLDDAIDLATSSGIRLDVTAFEEYPDDPAVEAAEALLQAHEAGIPMQRLTCSSDAGGSVPVFDEHGHLTELGVGTCAGLLATLRGLVQAGLSLAESLVPFTTAPADQLGLDHVGRLAVGTAANLVVLDDELAVRHVHAGGHWHVRDGQPTDRERFATGPS